MQNTDSEPRAAGQPRKKSRKSSAFNRSDPTKRSPPIPPGPPDDPPRRSPPGPPDRPSLSITELGAAMMAVTGLLTAFVPTIDSDILHSQVCDDLKNLVHKHFGKHGRILERTGLAPKFAVPLRTDKPFPKITQKFIPPNGDKDEKIEILGDGQQFVTAGIHPDTKQPYSWNGGEPGKVKRDELPLVTEEQLREFLAEASEVVLKWGYTKYGDAPAHTASKSGEHTFKPYQAPANDHKVAFALSLIPAHDYDDWFKIGCGLVRGFEQWKASQLFHWWSTGSSKYNEHECSKKFRDCVKGVAQRAEGAQVTIDTIYNIAKEIDPKWEVKWRETKLGKEETPVKLIQSSGEFVANFQPPDYLIDGLLQRCFVYSFTAPTGSGKTAVILLIAVHVALGKPLGNMEVEQGRVLIFAGENPDDVRTRWIKLCEEFGKDPEKIDVYFMPFRKDLSDEEIREQIDAEAKEHGPFSLLIVDTSASYYSGDDENDNVKLGGHARLLRTFVDLPGGPTVLVTCHPIKNANMDNLLPRGGGAFLAEVDGNLAGIYDGGTKVVEVTTHGKFRGPEFAPFSFQLVAATSEKLVDTKGRLIWTVFARPITPEQQDMSKHQGRTSQDELLRAMLDKPGQSLFELAERLAWRTQKGEPNKNRVAYVMKGLAKAKLVKQERGDGPYVLTKDGEEEADKTPLLPTRKEAIVVPLNPKDEGEKEG